MYNNFSKDLKFGEFYELKLLEHIKHKSYIKPPGNFKDYDIEILKNNGTKSTYEVKADRKIIYSGNICIEYMCKNKHSGISTSKAKYWAIFELKDETYTLYKIPTKILHNYIGDKKYFKDLSGGDYNNAKLYLFKKELFKDYIIYSNI